MSRSITNKIIFAVSFIVGYYNIHGALLGKVYYIKNSYDMLWIKVITNICVTCTEYYIT